MIKQPFNRITVLATLSLLCLGTLASAGWENPADPQSRAEIVFSDNGKWVFDLACSKNIALFLRYPGREQSGDAKIVISNSRKSISITGVLSDKTHDIDARDPPFSTAWTGRTSDPADLDAVMSILFSGLKLTFTAEGAKYVLPAISASVVAKYKSDCRRD
jgi:hypothetical protein